MRASAASVIPFQRRVQVAQRRTARTASLPAPTGGWNARDALGEMDPNDAVVLSNWYPAPTSCVLRGGYTIQASGFPAQVQSIFAYSGGTTNKLFGVADGKIYDATTAGAIGAAAVSGLTNSKWQYVNITNAGGSYIIAANGADDVRSFDGSSWASPSITGVTSSTLIGVNVHKNRLWFTQVGTLKAWYLPTQAIQGAAVALDLSAFCPHGGYLMGMATWTMDAGYGVDDMAVFITSNGDVLVYRGTDPSSASTWALVGVWWLGSPVGRRCFVKYNGDLLIICQDGVVPLSGALQSSRLNPRVALTDKINYAMSQAVTSYGTTFGWQLLPYPRENALILNVPVSSSTLQQQYVMNTITGAWCRFQGWYAACWELYQDSAYFGSGNFIGKAWDSTSDNGTAISTQALQAFNYFGSRGQQKRFSMWRPTFRTTGMPTIYGNVNVDFDESLPAPQLATIAVSGATWDSSLWDSGLWAGDAFSRSWQACTGVGYCAAPAITSSTQGMELEWISTDLIMEPGGAL